MYTPNGRGIEDLAKSIVKNTPQEALRMERAKEEFDKGNIAVAYRLYAVVASSRVPTSYTATAKERMESIRQTGREKCDDIDSRLDDLVKRMNIVSNTDDAPKSPDDEITQIFEDFKELLKQYHQVSPFGSWLTNHIAKQRARPECAAVLNEPDAAKLLKLGQTHEENNQLCCAYRSYEKAVKFLPAPSAQSAQSKLQKMKEDPQIVEAAKACAELEWCHRTYKRAEKLLEGNPQRAQELFSEIVKRSPAESSVHQEAEARLKELKQ